MKEEEVQAYIFINYVCVLQQSSYSRNLIFTCTTCGLTFRYYKKTAIRNASAHVVFVMSVGVDELGECF
jgi:hypothetical protein